MIPTTRLLLPFSATLVAACAGPSVPSQGTGSGGSTGDSGSGGVGPAGTTASAGASAGTAGAAGSHQGGAGTSAGRAGSGGSAGSAGAAGSNAGSTGASGASAGSMAGKGGAAGGQAVQDVACDFSASGNNCLLCGGASCIDTHSDPAHCGACNNVCPAGEACLNGSCGATITTGAGSYSPGALRDGKVYSWGYNGYLGHGAQSQGNGPIVSPLHNQTLGTGLRVATSSDMSCAADLLGDVRCVGLNALGQLGIGTEGGPDGCGVDPAPKLICYGAAQKTKIDNVTELRSGELWSGGTHACARKADRSIHCWGDLQKAGGDVSPSPLAVAGVPPSAGLAVTATAHCSRGCDGTVTCWGSNNVRQLGRVTPFAVATTPAPIPDLRLTSLAAGANHFCGIDEQRRLVCWGDSEFGQSGPGTTALPQIIAGVEDVVQVAVGNITTCARTAAGDVHCLGDAGAAGTSAPRPAGCTKDRCDVPTKVAIGDVAELGGGAAAMLARRKDGSYWAWGSTAAQLGNGVYKPNGISPQPEKVLPFP